jgi:hypothetical protein
MPTGLWRVLALGSAVLVLAFVVTCTVNFRSYTTDHMVTVPADGHSFARLRVTSVDGTPEENGGLRPGDTIELLGGNHARQELAGEPAGTRLTWLVQRGRRHFTTVSRVTNYAANDLLLIEIFNLVRIAMLLVAILVAVRRPDVPAARALVTFLIAMAATLIDEDAAWLPDPAFIAAHALRAPLQIYSFSQALAYACLFPVPAAGGVRGWLRRVNPWYALVTAATALGIEMWIRVNDRLPPSTPFNTVLQWSPIAFFPAIAVAFAVARSVSDARDRQRVNWVAGSILVGFSGPIVAAVAVLGFGTTSDWTLFLALTLIALPAGLAYTILRHRTIDIGFVISRALVLTILSFVIIAVFGLLERALGKIFIDASHVESRSVEIALALGLGFSLRPLHARIERLVDGIFFRHRRHALAALKAFANDVYFITDPDVAIERTVEVAARSAGATGTALFLIADGVFGRAAAEDADTFPSEVGENDPLFVRMRASRKPENPRALASGLDAEIAFPAFVRGTLVAVLVLAPKRTGETYDPEEIALLAELAQRVGLALDALQTIAMRRELDALMAATGGPRPAL